MDNVRGRVARRRQIDRAFSVMGAVCTCVGLLTISILLGALAWQGLGRITWQFLTSFPSRFPAKAGILSALVGTALVTLVTVIVTIPVGVATAIYLDEFAPRSRLASFIELNIANLAGVPSIVYGLLALGLFVYRMKLGHSIAAAGLTLGLLVLPIVIVASREALRSIPQDIREASFAQGATRWQTVRHHLLPYSLSGIATGVIIAISRAMGETAPLVTVGALTFIAFLPPSPLMDTPPFVNFAWLESPFTVLPIQVFNWISRPQKEFHELAAAAALLLILATLLMNSLAIWLRRRARRRTSW